MWLLQNKPEKFWNDQTKKICIVNFVPTLSLSFASFVVDETRKAKEREPGNEVDVSHQATNWRELWVNLVIMWLISANYRARGIVGEW